MNNFLSTIGEIIKYGGSTFAALAVMSLYTTTDGIFIGNFVGNDGLEAMALILPVTIIFMALSTLFEVGGSAVVAEKIGAGKKNACRRNNANKLPLRGDYRNIFGDYRKYFH